MTQTRIFWIGCCVISLGGAIVAITYFPEAFSFVTLDLRMNREMALNNAQTLAEQHEWGPKGFRQAASFDVDWGAQNFVELEAGGNTAFSAMLKEDLYSPYTWRVRHFKENKTNETLIRFTPAGQAYGFVEKLSEDEPGARLSTEEARVIAETAAQEIWFIDLTEYELVEELQDVRPGERIDHTFIYERPDVRVGEGRYRLRLVVSGEKLTELTHFIKIPEAFWRRYWEMRSSNQTITNIASIATLTLYGLGGCLIGLFFLLRQRWVLWRKPLFWGIVVAALLTLTAINWWPLTWLWYDTALSLQVFGLQRILIVLLIFGGAGIGLTLIFMVAESLTRKAFLHHIQLWRLWSPDVACSHAVLGRTIGGYLLVGIATGSVVALYFFTSKILGWWNPSNTLFQPDLLATYFPWLTGVAISLHAGFTEECLFRAIPLAGAALLGQRFGHRRSWIGAALVVQAFIFGAMHANYPAQPAYARVVELVIPSVILGGIYLVFGLLPAIISHVTFDVVCFAFPLFVSSAPGIWIDRLLLILFTLIPLWVVLYARWRSGKWIQVKSDYYNHVWQPPEKQVIEPVVPEVTEPPAIGTATFRRVLIGGMAGLIVWMIAANFEHAAPSLSIGRNKAEKLAQETLRERGIEISDSWRILSTVDIPLDQDDRFAWQEGGKEIYKALMGTYLAPPCWKVRFAQFEGDIVERAEEYHVFLAGDGEIVRVSHQLPESRPGVTLNQEEARTLADTVIQSTYHLDPASLKEVAAEPFKLPERQDWVFTFADEQQYPLTEGEARVAIRIAGDAVVDMYRYLHIPEEWAREERNQRSFYSMLRGACWGVLSLLTLIGAFTALVSWSRKKFSVTTFVRFLVLSLGLCIIILANNWSDIVVRFFTDEPLSHQIFSAIAFRLAGSVLLATGIALLLGFLQHWKRPQASLPHSKAILIGCALGIVGAGLLALMTAFTPSLSPIWADYGAASGTIPLLEVGLIPLGVYLAITTMVLFTFTAVDRLTNGWTRRKGVFTFGFIVLGVIATGLRIQSLSLWLIAGPLAGMLLLLTYYYVFRFHLAFIPLTGAAVTILYVCPQAIFQAYPAAIPGAALAILCTSLLALYWYAQLNRQ